MAFGLCCIFQGFNNEQLKYILIEQVTLLKPLVSTFSTCTALSQWSGDETLPATNFSTPLMPATTLAGALASPLFSPPLMSCTQHGASPSALTLVAANWGWR